MIQSLALLPEEHRGNVERRVARDRMPSSAQEQKEMNHLLNWASMMYSYTATAVILLHCIWNH